MAAAAHNPNPEVITTLIRAGAKIETKDEKGMTPLMYAAGYNTHPEVISTLLKADVKVNEKNSQ